MYMGLVNKKIIADEVKQLTDKQKTIFACCYLEKFSTAERIDLLNAVKKITKDNNINS